LQENCREFVQIFHIKNKLQENTELDYDQTTFVMSVVYSHYLVTFMYQFHNKLEIKSLLMTINLCRVYILFMTYQRIGHCISSLLIQDKMDQGSTISSIICNLSNFNSFSH
jgi:hypothetical protein